VSETIPQDRESTKEKQKEGPKGGKSNIIVEQHIGEKRKVSSKDKMEGAKRSKR
jgi:hypothetical protein